MQVVVKTHGSWKSAVKIGVNGIQRSSLELMLQPSFHRSLCLLAALLGILALMPYNQRSVDPTVEKLIPPDLTLLSSSSIAALWSSYGHIYRISTISKEKDEKTPRLLVLKHIHPPRTTHASLSHSRKLTSYAVERYFYTELAPRLPPTVAVARAYPTAAPGILLLDDLSTDFPRPARGSLGAEDTRSVLRWLAGFHATFWGVKGTVPPPVAGQVAEVGAESRGVWEQGTYYYLDTRREEMADVDAEGDMNWIVPWADRVCSVLSRNCGNNFTSSAAYRSTMLLQQSAPRIAALYYMEMPKARISFSLHQANARSSTSNTSVRVCPRLISFIFLEQASNRAYSVRMARYNS
jgi:hypothetical protein